MTDRRLLPANGRVAHIDLRDRVEADRYLEPASRQVASRAAFLHAAPDGRRDRELIHGDGFEVLEELAGWSFGRATRDGYVGYLRSAALGPRRMPTHAVALRETHLYAAPDIKAPPLLSLPFGAALALRQIEGRWAHVEGGCVPASHLRPLDTPLADPVAVAETCLGAPYLWAGNTARGIDCSGLVQNACLACGIPCPGDSDLQEGALGVPLDEGEPLRRGDLLFWRGHVAWVADARRILHANAHAMAVTLEETQAALSRIEAQGDGPLTSRRRL